MVHCWHRHTWTLNNITIIIHLWFKVSLKSNMNSFVIICPRENKVFIAVHFSLKTMVDGLISLNQLIQHLYACLWKLCILITHLTHICTYQNSTNRWKRFHLWPFFTKDRGLECNCTFVVKPLQQQLNLIL